MRKRDLPGTKRVQRHLPEHLRCLRDGAMMNKEQREKLQGALDILTEIQEQEQEKYDNAPEGLQETDRVQKFQENSDNLQEALDTIQGVLDE